MSSRGHRAETPVAVLAKWRLQKATLQELNQNWQRRFNQVISAFHLSVCLWSSWCQFGTLQMGIKHGEEL